LFRNSGQESKYDPDLDKAPCATAGGCSPKRARSGGATSASPAGIAQAAASLLARNAITCFFVRQSVHIPIRTEKVVASNALLKAARLAIMTRSIRQFSQ
jgi:hypothetical protein